jgi:hypothetical protein
MTLRIFTIFLEPVNPLQFSLPEFRSFLTGRLAEYQSTVLPGAPAGQIIHRYPAILCKLVKNDLMVIGIYQGAGFLREMTKEHAEIMSGQNRCTIASRDSEIREEEFGVTGRMYEYEILTPWLALNQQNAKKFYDLKGKPARDAFMQKILTAHLNNLAKSLDCSPGEPVTCIPHVRFIRERIDRENVIVFLGKFRTNLCIPDYLGIGQSVSQGYGTIRKIPAMQESSQELTGN